MAIWEVKLVPIEEPNADGRWTTLDLHRESAFDEVFETDNGAEFVVQKRREQPFYMHGGHSVGERATRILPERWLDLMLSKTLERVDRKVALSQRSISQQLREAMT